MPKEPEIIPEDAYLASMDLDPDVVAKSKFLRNNMSGFEKKIWKLIGEGGNPWNLLRQIPMRGFYLDFYSPNYMACIEADGPHHVNTREYDKRRDVILRREGIRTLRITPVDLKYTSPLALYEHINNFIESD